MNIYKKYKTFLEEDELPKKYYNVRPEMRALGIDIDPMLNPVNYEEATTADFYPVFCKVLVEQELNNTDREISIPEEIQAFYTMYRPSPLVRARFLEKKLDTPAKIYYKFEGQNTSGSHKLNSAIAQAYYAKEQGLTGVTTETGAGQWGTALAMATGFFGIDCHVFMVKCSAMQKPHRCAVIETYNGNITHSPSDKTEVGRKILEQFPSSGGSLGCAISEAVETALASNGKERYVLGSVLNQVILHQSIIGLECQRAFEKLEEYPDIIIGCAGGGSNFGGLIAPFMGEKLRGEKSPYFIAVEPASCPTLTRGKYAYDFCDTGHVTPLAKMYTLGSLFMPSADHAGGLRYHGMSPILSKLYKEGYLEEARAVKQREVFDTACYFARIEGTLPAPESAHAIKVAIDEAKKCKETGEEKIILFGLTGTGYFDMSGYSSYRNGTMSDYAPSDEELEKGFKCIPKI
ncbi:MAG: TrpB-like pyridoxal phosphate-dependent enzyme [Eggerthellaceae bacterium]|nr:TrpB-like pyridoxal phosphate-dependent enzyme [Eggerthellaceae bacterium]